MATIESRRDQPADPLSAKKSYTVKLLEGGTAKIGGKITEEAAEVVEAAGEPGDDGRSHFVYECADLVYHLFVMMAHRGVKLAELETELARRFGISGLEEKASRKPAES
jgi:phosphoribosyl-ATP pyrophosphohydrolase